MGRCIVKVLLQCSFPHRLCAQLSWRHHGRAAWLGFLTHRFQLSVTMRCVFPSLLLLKPICRVPLSWPTALHAEGLFNSLAGSTHIVVNSTQGPWLGPWSFYRLLAVLAWWMPVRQKVEDSSLCALQGNPQRNQLRALAINISLMEWRTAHQDPTAPNFQTAHASRLTQCQPPNLVAATCDLAGPFAGPAASPN
eukprot:GGOE01065178.1.p1 GENE.GGOE01065178.1~~GGOE01065178.1.p1  ORF type:complete len:227 (+),score=1.35 GGOE01065178.1:101-682(+)